METEELTRKTKIGVLLKEQGWDVSDLSKVRIEINTKQSDFKNGEIIHSRLLRKIWWKNEWQT